MAVYNEEGRYQVKIADALLSEARNEKKTPQVELHLELIGKYDDGELYECSKPRYAPIVYLSITDNTMGTPTAPGWVAETLASLGFTGSFDDIDKLTGTTCDASCTYEDNLKGNQRERWNIERPGGRKRVLPEKKVTRQLSSRFSKIFKGTPQANGKAAPQPAAAQVLQAENTSNGDDIPF